MAEIPKTLQSMMQCLPSSTRVHELVSAAGTDCVRLARLTLPAAEAALLGDAVGGCGLATAAGD